MNLEKRFHVTHGLCTRVVTYQGLSKLDFGIWYQVNDAVRFMREYHPKKPVYFLIQMDPDRSKDGIAQFGIQKHDCKEVVNITQGHLIEILEGNRLYVKGDRVFYPVNYYHKPSARVYSEYEVEFIKA